MDEKQKLAPCPFCGNKQDGNFGGLQIIGNPRTGYRVLCGGKNGCGAAGPYHAEKPVMWPIEQWNSRSGGK